MTRWLGVCAAVVSVVVVSLVLHWGTSGRAGTPAFELSVSLDVRPSLSILLWLDLYILLVFLAILGWCGREILAGSKGGSQDNYPHE